MYASKKHNVSNFSPSVILKMVKGVKTIAKKKTKMMKKKLSTEKKLKFLPMKPNSLQKSFFINHA